VLLPTAQANLVFISDYSGKHTSPATKLPARAQTAASSAVFGALLEHGVGVSADGELRAPRTPAELRGIPAVSAVIAALNEAENRKTNTLSEHAGNLDTTPPARLGWWLLKALRHMGAHVYFETPHVLRNGLTAAAASGVVRAAASAIAANSGGKIGLAADGALDFVASGVAHARTAPSGGPVASRRAP